MHMYLDNFTKLETFFVTDPVRMIQRTFLGGLNSLLTNNAILTLKSFMPLVLSGKPSNIDVYQ